MGHFVTEAFGYDGGRDVTVHVPPDPPEAVGWQPDSDWHCQPEVLPGRLPRAYLVAGTLEPFFFENAKRWAGALRSAGADVVMYERVGSHGDAFWQDEFPVMVAWAFGTGSTFERARPRDP